MRKLSNKRVQRSQPYSRPETSLRFETLEDRRLLSAAADIVFLLDKSGSADDGSQREDVMKQIRTAVLVMCIGVVVSTGNAAILYESGTLGPTEVTWEQVTSGEVLGVNVSPAVFGGVRFQLSVPVVTKQVGGHFVSRPDADDSFFGAIIRLDGESDFPNSADLSTSDVRGATLLTFPNVSAEVFGELNLLLEPGWYALVFGSGLFNATGAGASLRNNADIGTPDYIGFQLGSGWGERASQDGKRFLVLGNIVPEPTAFFLSTLAPGLFLSLRMRRM